jgi:Family of unknown function (DUF6655)
VDSVRGVSTLIAAAVAASCLGCTTSKTTNTARSATEQLLVSSSVDQALAKVDFRPFGGRNVFVEEKYLDGVDKNYILASVRHHVVQAGGGLSAKPEQADVMLEVRSGGVGTNSKDMFLGSPALSVPGPFPVSLPEIKLMSRSTQTGIAKLGLVAYDAKTRRSLGTGGVAVSQSDDNNWFFFGFGPYQKGSVRAEFARQAAQSAQGRTIPDVVAFRGGDAPLRFRLTSERRDDGQESPPWK